MSSTTEFTSRVSISSTTAFSLLLNLFSPDLPPDLEPDFPMVLPSPLFPPDLLPDLPLDFLHLFFDPE